MGLFKKRATDPDEIARLKAEIASMSARIKASDEAKHALDTTVQGLVTRLDTPAPAPTPTPLPPVAPPSKPTIDPAEIDKLNAKIERLTSRVDQTNAVAPTMPTVDPVEVALLAESMQRISTRIDEMDQRITSISTELANQISEMSGDIEAMGAHEPPADEVVGELRDAQTRLASEQARYQIAFRQDLAELADRLRRA
jgi:tetrahydromethanopterin S-methyltransferase subunit G